MNKMNDTEGFKTSWKVPNQPSSGNPATPAVAGTHRLARKSLRSVVFAGVGCLAIVALANVARPAAVTDIQRSAGGGSGSASIVDFSEAARSPDAKTPVPVDPRIDEFHRRARPGLPSRPTSGSRKVPPVAAAPHLAPIVSSNFDGISQMGPCGGCGVPPDPNAATSGTEIVELVNTFIQVSQTPTAPSSVAAA